MYRPQQWKRALAAVATAVLIAAVNTEAQAQEEGLPRNLDDMVAWGKEVFFGKPSCVTCHGVAGKGSQRGPDLSDKEWIHGTGTFNEIAELVRHGVPKTESETDREMPYRGWMHAASDMEIRAVAAYVWSLSH
jgi:mono/diheme cytochrome c family protein